METGGESSTFTVFGNKRDCKNTNRSSVDLVDPSTSISGCFIQQIAGPSIGTALNVLITRVPSHIKSLSDTVTIDFSPSTNMLVTGHSSADFSITFEKTRSCIEITPVVSAMTQFVPLSRMETIGRRCTGRITNR